MHVPNAPSYFADGRLSPMSEYVNLMCVMYNMSYIFCNQGFCHPYPIREVSVWKTDNFSQLDLFLAFRRYEKETVPSFGISYLQENTYRTMNIKRC